MAKTYHFRLTLPKRRGEYCLFSLPATNQYQQINNLSIKPSAYKLQKDKWGNKAAIFTLNDVVKELKIDFQINPKSNTCNIKKNYKIDYYQKLLKPDRFINGQDEKIKRLAMKAIGKEKNLYKTIYSLYQFTLNYLTYGKPIEGLYTYKQAMEERITDCGGFSTFLASLLQSLNIPSRLVVGFLIKENLLSKILFRFKFYTLSFKFLMMHAWLEFLLPDNSWFPLDPSIEWRRAHGLTKREGGFGYIPEDRLVVSFGQYHQLTIGHQQYKINLLQKPVYL